MTSQNTTFREGEGIPVLTRSLTRSINLEQPSQQLQPNGQEFRPVFGQLATNGQTPLIRPTAFGRGRATQQLVFGPNTGGQRFPFSQLQTQQPSNETEGGNDWINPESSTTDLRKKRQLEDQCKSLMNKLESVMSLNKESETTIAHLKRKNGVLETAVANLNKEIGLLRQVTRDTHQENVKLKNEAEHVEEANRMAVKIATQQLTAVHNRMMGELKVQHQKELQQAKATEAGDDSRKATGDAAEVKLREEVKKSEEAHRAAIQKLKAEHERIVRQMKALHEEELKRADDSRKAKDDATVVKLKEEAKRLEEAQRATIEKLTTEHDRVIREMKSQHERELQAKSAEVPVTTSSPIEKQAWDGASIIRQGFVRGNKADDSGLAELEESVREWQSEEREGREKDMEEIMALLANLDKNLEGKVGKLETLIESKHLDGRHGHRNDVKAMKGNMEKKMDLKFDHLENCIDILVQDMHKQHQGVVQAVQTLDVKGSFSRVEGLVGGLEEKIADSCQGGRKNNQGLTNAIGNNDKAIRDVCKITDALLQEGRQQHAEEKQGIVNLAEEGEKMENLLHVLLREGRQQNKELKQTFQDLNVDIDTKVSKLTQTLQQGGRQHQQDMLNAISSSTEEIEKMLSDLSESLDQNGGEQHDDLKQTIGEMDEGFQAKMANLEDFISSNRNEGQQIEDLGENIDRKLSEMLGTLQQGGQVQHTEMTRMIKNLDSEIDKKVKNLEEWVENLSVKTVKQSTIKVCNV